MEIHQRTSNSNIALSLQDKINETNYNQNLTTDSLTLKKNQKQLKENSDIKETFPSVSLSVKNPVSSKVLIIMIIFQIFSNIGILYFLYLGME